MGYRRRKRTFTREAIANMRYRYVETDEPIDSIAGDYGLVHGSFNKIRKREAWPLRSSRREGLPADLKLADDAQKAVAAHLDESAESEPLTVADRLERAVEKELAAIERRRATLADEPMPVADAERTARTIERLTETQYKIRRLRLPDDVVAGQVPACDIPKNIDGLRDALAQRIAILRNGASGENPPGPEPGAASSS